MAQQLQDRSRAFMPPQLKYNSMLHCHTFPLIILRPDADPSLRDLGVLLLLIKHNSGEIIPLASPRPARNGQTASRNLFDSLPFAE